jgi:hypothetical protein
MPVAVQLSVAGWYLPPVFKTVPPPNPPHTIISLPVQIAVRLNRAAGELVELVALQLSVVGLYIPPVFVSLVTPYPPHTIISLPVQTAV